MVCVLALILHGHSFELGFYKACYYKCPNRRNYRIYRIDPDYQCPMGVKG